MEAALDAKVWVIFRGGDWIDNMEEFDTMLNVDRENFKLAAMRDALLPKLMSGEVDVSNMLI